MAIPVASTTESTPGGPKKFLFNKDYVTLREELRLTEQQRMKVRHLFENWELPYVDVLPTTKLVHRPLAEKKLDLKSCVYITGPSPENLAVFAAPKFCCRKPMNRRVVAPYTTYYCPTFVNIEKCDLRVITEPRPAHIVNYQWQPADTPPSMPADFEKLRCFVCKRSDEQGLKHRLFALPCGHFTCRSCWLKHCTWELAREFCPISCPNGDCSEKLTLNRAAAILSDSAIGIIVEFEWRNKLRQTGNVRCATCKRWMELVNVFRKIMTAGCECGCFTCVRCGELEHAPLRCRDAAVWSEIRAKENENDAAAAAAEIWQLTREQFEECCAPSKDIATDEFKTILRFMKTYDKINGAMLEKDMPMVARMLEMWLVQQLAQRKEMQPVHEHNEGVMGSTQRWEHLAKYFAWGLDTLHETKTKARYLHQAKEWVLNYYHF